MQSKRRFGTNAQSLLSKDKLSNLYLIPRKNNTLASWFAKAVPRVLNKSLWDVAPWQQVLIPCQTLGTQEWKDWILIVRKQLGIIDLADMIYVRSEFYREKQSRFGEVELEAPILFGMAEGKIAFANRKGLRTRQT